MTRSQVILKFNVLNGKNRGRIESFNDPMELDRSSGPSGSLGLGVFVLNVLILLHLKIIDKLYIGKYRFYRFK